LTKLGSSAVVTGLEAVSQKSELESVANTEVLKQKPKMRMMLNFIFVIDKFLNYYKSRVTNF